MLVFLRSSVVISFYQTELTFRDEPVILPLTMDNFIIKDETKIATVSLERRLRQEDHRCKASLG
jgi:hypothetical protein